MIFWMWLWCTGSLVSSTASGRSRARMANAPAKSSALRASTAVNARPRPGAASRSCSRITALETLSGFHSSATRAADGMISLTSCSRFGPRSGDRMVLPVTLPPGCARLCTRPARTGSPTGIMTIGMVEVAALAARLAGVP